MLTKNGTKLNKNNKYRDQIEYRTLTLTRDTLLDWHVDIWIFKEKIKKFKKITKWHVAHYCVDTCTFKKKLKKF